jgi:hypothetical protein
VNPRTSLQCSPRGLDDIQQGFQQIAGSDDSNRLAVLDYEMAATLF